MKTILKIAAFLLIPFFGMSQSIEKYSVDGGGLSTSNGGVRILYTIGEVNVQELIGRNIRVSEGFINPNNTHTANTDLMYDDYSDEKKALKINSLILESVLVYPNPTENIIYIKSPNTFMTTAVIYDATGRKVIEKDANKGKYLQIDLSKITSSIYYLEISTEAGKITKQIIKNRKNPST